MTDTTAQLITELEKRGVLTWEVGDVAVYNGLSCSVFFVSPGTLGGFDWQAYAKDCTHSADDPRLLGRVLRELEERIVLIEFYDSPSSEVYFEITNKDSDGLKTTVFNEKTLLEAALLAWRAKILEGEK